MAYEIPQQLEYKEKIMFGLTFKQLAYLFLFAPIIVIIFFKTNWHIIIKIIISVNFMAFAVGFIFLNLDQHLRNWINWYKSKKIEKPHKLAKFIPVKEIKDNLIITNDNRKLAVIRILPINFSIKPEESKDAITASFQKFLNALDFPIQIVMNTEKLDLTSYLKDIKNKTKPTENFEKLFEVYKKHLESIAKENDVMNRRFYIIIPEKTDLSIQLQICQSKLGNMGLKSFRLKDKELKILLKRFFEAKKDFYPTRIENYSSYIKTINEEEKHEKETEKQRRR